LHKQVIKKTSGLTYYDKNPRKHPASQIKQLASSINKYGFTVPLIIDENDMVLAGHGRLQAAHELGIEDVNCVVVNGLSESDKRAYVIADNRISDLSDWNWDRLMSELRDFALDDDFDWEDIGFGDVDISELLADVLPEESNEPAPLEVVAPKEPYKPNVAPTQSVSEVHGGDLDKAGKKLELDNSEQARSDDLQVACPSCFHEFVVRP